MKKVCDIKVGNGEEEIKREIGGNKTFEKYEGRHIRRERQKVFRLRGLRVRKLRA